MTKANTALFFCSVFTFQKWKSVLNQKFSYFYSKMPVPLLGLNNILLRNVMYNIHIHIYTYFCGTGSDRKLKADINHLLINIPYFYQQTSIAVLVNDIAFVK